MLTYEIMRQFVMAGLFGMILGLDIFGLVYLIKSAVSGIKSFFHWIRKKHSHKADVTE
ncbi:MAG: hypothetical protein LKK26_06595 [Solobacterium sp.]|nr:hypothetical protein [Solobacterium sp.]